MLKRFSSSAARPSLGGGGGSLTEKRGRLGAPAFSGPDPFSGTAEKVGERRKRRVPNHFPQRSAVLWKLFSPVSPDPLILRISSERYYTGASSYFHHRVLLIRVRVGRTFVDSVSLLPVPTASVSFVTSGSRQIEFVPQCS